tara:strand:- start:3578 stop:4522 length:945 start_codon:yes stop_codon:yes gene_type:complete
MNKNKNNNNNNNKNNNNNNNNFNLNNINLNKLKNYLPEDNHVYFFIMIAIFLIVLVILIIRNFLRGASLYQRYVKNVFFREMDNLDGKPKDASNTEGDFEICIQGETKSINSIPNINLHVKSDYLLMFWVKLESEKIHDFIKSNKTIVPLVSFNGNNKFYPKFEMNIMNNEMSVYVGDDSGEPEGTLYNLPYDDWFCITSFVTQDHMDIYINGKLVKIIEYSKLSIDVNNSFNMKIGSYPGSIAYLQVNNDSSYFNPSSVYQEYLVYKNLIKQYVDNEYHKHYKITKMLNPKHDDGSYNRAYKKSNQKPNICKK